MDSVPHVAPEHPLPDKLQVTPLPDVSLITVAVMLTDLPWSTVCAAEAMLTEIGRDGLPPPQPKSVTARTRVDTIPRRDIAFFELMEASFLILGEIPHTGASCMCVERSRPGILQKDCVRTPQCSPRTSVFALSCSAPAPRSVTRRAVVGIGIRPSCWATFS